MCQQKVAWAVRLAIRDRTAKRVLIQLCDAWQSGACFPSIERIAERIVASRATVKRGLLWLDQHGLITRKRTGRACDYSINFEASDGSLDEPSANVANEPSDGSLLEPSDGSPGDPLTNLTNLTNPSLRSGVTHARARAAGAPYDPHQPVPPELAGAPAAPAIPVEASCEPATNGHDRTTMGLGTANGDANPEVRKSRGRPPGRETEPHARARPHPARDRGPRRAGDRSQGELIPLAPNEMKLISNGALTAEEQQNGRRLPDRGTRLPADWQPSPELEQFARDHGIDPHTTRDCFVDYWIARPGAAAVKLDWPATWRNWCRRADRDGAMGGRQTRAVRPARGDDAFYDQLAIIARRG